MTETSHWQIILISFAIPPLMKCTWWTTTNAWDGKQHATTCEMINTVLGDPQRIPNPGRESALNLNLSYNPKKSFLWHVQWHYIKCSQLPKHNIMAYYNNKPSAVTNIQLNFFPILASVNSEYLSQLNKAVQTKQHYVQSCLCITQGHNIPIIKKSSLNYWEFEKLLFCKLYYI